MNDFSSELRDLIDKWRDTPGYALPDIIDELEDAVEQLVEEVNAHT